MPEAYYIIPMVDPPYSRVNPQRPKYVDEIRCNWTGHNVDLFGVYICMVNTSAAKHADLASRDGVVLLGDGWNKPASDKANKWASGKKLKPSANEAVGNLANRIIKNGNEKLKNKSGHVWPGGDRTRVMVEEF